MDDRPRGRLDLDVDRHQHGRTELARGRDRNKKGRAGTHALDRTGSTGPSHAVPALALLAGRVVGHAEVQAAHGLGELRLERLARDHARGERRVGRVELSELR